MNKKIRSVILLFACLAFLTGMQSLHAQRKPNVLFYLTDDLGYGDVGCYGAEGQYTPAIDQLAKEGTKFTSFYVHQRCTPSRAAFMTGTYAHRIGLNQIVYKHRQGPIGLNPSEITFPELLQTAGYKTALVGKWHLGEWEPFHPLNHGFDYFYGFLKVTEGTEDVSLVENRKQLAANTKKTAGQAPGMVKAAVDFMKTHRDEPFFLYYSDPLPHSPYVPSEEFKGSSERGDYGDVVHEIDWQFNHLMNALKELGLEEDTIVVFTSDNGPPVQRQSRFDVGLTGPLRDGKWTDFEGGVRVPFIVRWPGKVKPGAESDAMIGIIDMLPTFCGIAGVGVPNDRIIDGVNVLPQLLGDTMSEHLRDVQIVPGSTITRNGWKYYMKTQFPYNRKSPEVWGEFKPANAGSLFNLNEDVGETTDVSSQYPEIAESLRKEMEAFMVEFEATTRPVGDASGLPDKTFKLDRLEMSPEEEGKKRSGRKEKKRTREKREKRS
ncbi:sulfatase-like hydrolase/transferase [Pelagicoccus mobilis]|uniref:Sulfatase-like hydrolase/transferase n=1 Tax=Pelagicoccus mobilis TaxID=415221 RepID=A0A934RRZ8_9BACT|nr:sulfatase-like hydrolase/transferase [Pelagicoccus mobilis]MBK1876505.1 sulfatase-like hydrolase/transferase [Pelagicoccus mobilis]